MCPVADAVSGTLTAIFCRLLHGKICRRQGLVRNGGLCGLAQHCAVLDWADARLRSYALVSKTESRQPGGHGPSLRVLLYAMASGKGCFVLRVPTC